MKKEFQFKEGEVLQINKPLHWTSFQVVNKLRWLIKRKLNVIKLGATTPSYDGESAENRFYSTQHINADLITQTLQSFLGDLQQFPPIFSAIKVDGKKLYESARKGKEVEIKPRTISIQDIELLSIEMPYVSFRVACSKGTYIRSLAYDLGKAMHSGAWLTKLQRTKIGAYELKNALDIQDFELLMKS